MTDTNTIPFSISPGLPGADEVHLRFPAEYAAELQLLLDEQDLTYSRVQEFSAIPEALSEAVTAVAVSGGIASTVRSLAAAITAFCHRHDGKTFKIGKDENITEASGVSEKVILKEIEEARRRQAENNEEWQRLRSQSRHDGDA